MAGGGGGGEEGEVGQSRTSDVANLINYGFFNRLSLLADVLFCLAQNPFSDLRPRKK